MTDSTTSDKLRAATLLGKLLREEREELLSEFEELSEALWHDGDAIRALCARLRSGT